MPASKKISDNNHIEKVFDNLIKKIGEESKEFQLPDWLNKAKPTPYIFIKRSIYLTKRKNKKKTGEDGIFCCCSSLSPSSSSSIMCGRDCHCRALRSFCSSSCKCGSECNNKPFHQRPVKKLKLVQTEKCGSGIVAEEEIERGEFIIEYVGEVIDDQTCGERLWKMKHLGETNFYLCEITSNIVIDATHKGNKSRYINHSCNPNTEMQKWTVDGETRIAIFAIRDIKKGEHVTYDYQFVHFGEDIDCHCGAVGCRLTLGKRSKTKVATKVALEEAFNLVASEVAQTLPMVHQNEGIHEDKQFDSPGTFWNNLIQMETCPRNCVGEVIRLSRPTSDRCFGIIRHFDEFSRRHSVMFEDGVTEFIDMNREDWEIVTA